MGSFSFIKYSVTVIDGSLVIFLNSEIRAVKLRCHLKSKMPAMKSTIKP